MVRQTHFGTNFGRKRSLFFSSSSSSEDVSSSLDFGNPILVQTRQTFQWPHTSSSSTFPSPSSSSSSELSSEPSSAYPIKTRIEHTQTRAMGLHNNKQNAPSSSVLPDSSLPATITFPSLEILTSFNATLINFAVVGFGTAGIGASSSSSSPKS